MTKLESILVYIYSKYPNPLELSKARLVKIIYLADWKNVLVNNSQISETKWYFNHYGPFVKEIIDDIRSSEFFEIYSTKNSHGLDKELIRLKSNISIKSVQLTDKEISTIDFVINITSKLYWDDFIRLVYSTYPIMKMPKLSYLNLIELASDYKAFELEPA